jgi:hypothetical protein
MVLSALATAGPCAAQKQVSGSQSSTAPLPRQQGNADNSLSPGLDPFDSPFADTTRQKRNEDRQRRIVSDTQRLLTLANQLKAEIAASGAESMTPEMLRQMDEIEKLAKSVKDRMRD